jgi:hypothetical protein
MQLRGRLATRLSCLLLQQQQPKRNVTRYSRQQRQLLTMKHSCSHTAAA